ncbi:MAG: response regulator transcription factor [Clostridiales bacterium]|nr:response regulator transcription factor [Clostridiales bacterium]
MARVLVVEDDPIIGQTVEYALRRAGFDATLCPDGYQALQIAREEPPDVIILDIMLPGTDGYSFAEQFRKVDSQTAIIMVTALDQERDKVRGLDAGADDYMTKPFSMEELLARVRANLRRVRERAVLTADEPIATGDLYIEPSELRVSVAGKPARLRLKEFQLLVALARNEGTLQTRERLARHVWGYEFLPSSRTIDVHIRRLRQAVEEPSAYDYIHTVHGMGYRFDPVPKGDVSTDAIDAGG